MACFELLSSLLAPSTSDVELCWMPSRSFLRLSRSWLREDELNAFILSPADRTDAADLFALSDALAALFWALWSA